MALNEHERDVINALILRVNDITFEVATLQVAGKRWFDCVPTLWLRKKMGWDKWPSPARYDELMLFVDAAPIVELVRDIADDNGTDRGTGTRTDIPGYYRGRRTGKGTPFHDFESDTGTN